MLLSVRPEFHAHIVKADDDGVVAEVEDMSQSTIWINGGFFVFKREIIDLIEPGEELVVEPFARLIERGELLAYPLRRILRPDGHDQGQQRLEALHESGMAPWRTSVPAWHPNGRRPLMQSLKLTGGVEPLERLLVIGAHADDIEIGCGGTILTLTRAIPGIAVDWVVLAAAADARVGGAGECRGIPGPRRELADRGTCFRDGFLPYVGAEVKDVFEELKRGSTHSSSSPTPATTSTRITGSCASSRGTRSATISSSSTRSQSRRRGRFDRMCSFHSRPAVAEREDRAAAPSLPKPVRETLVRRGRLPGLMRLRGMEANAPERLAEAFVARKVQLLP